MGAIFSRVKLSKRQVILLIVFMLVAAIAEMMLPTMLANMIDGGVAQNSKTMIFTLAIVMAVMAVLACAASVISTRLSAKISTKFAADLRREIFYQVQGFSAAETDKFGTDNTAFQAERT